MPTPSWSEVEALGSVIAKAIRAAAGSKIHREVWDDLLLEGKIAAYKALENHDPSKMDKETWVYQAVVKHIKRVLNQYLPAENRYLKCQRKTGLFFRKVMISHPIRPSLSLSFFRWLHLWNGSMCCMNCWVGRSHQDIAKHG